MINTKKPVLARDFVANDTQGRLLQLTDYLGKKHIVLVLNRALSWPNTRQYMQTLRKDYQEFLDRDSEVIVVGPEKIGLLATYWRSTDLPFIGVPDPSHTIARLYGQDLNPLKMGRLQALVVIDKKGRIRYENYGTSVNDIPSNNEILYLLDELNKETYW